MARTILIVFALALSSPGESRRSSPDLQASEAGRPSRLWPSGESRRSSPNLQASRAGRPSRLWPSGESRRSSPVLQASGGGPRDAAIPADVSKLLQSIKAADRGQLSVSEEDGRFLRVIVAATGATKALEIGSAYGYSAVWIGLGLRQTGGRLTTIEFDAERAKAAADNIRRAGLADIVTVVAGDAFKEIPKIPGTFDFVFLDAWKPDYKRFFELVVPRLVPHGLFLAHNVVNKQAEMRDFLSAIENHPALFTTIVAPSGEGMSVSVKIK